MTTGVVGDGSRTQKPRAGSPQPEAPRLHTQGSAPGYGLHVNGWRRPQPRSSQDRREGPPPQQPRQTATLAPHICCFWVFVLFHFWPDLTQRLLAPSNDPDPLRGQKTTTSLSEQTSFSLSEPLPAQEHMHMDPCIQIHTPRPRAPRGLPTSCSAAPPQTTLPEASTRQRFCSPG